MAKHYLTTPECLSGWHTRMKTLMEKNAEFISDFIVDRIERRDNPFRSGDAKRARNAERRLAT